VKNNKEKYTLDYQVSIPHLHSAKRLIPYNERLGDFTYSFSKKILDEFQLNGISFSFFIRWNDEKDDGPLDNEIWIKRELKINGDQPINLYDPQFLDKVMDTIDVEKANDLMSVFKKNRLICYYLLIKGFSPDIKLKPEDNIAIKMKFLKNSLSVNDIYTFNSFKEILIEKSGGLFINKKPLYSYETELEHYLSEEKAGALFPGDCDMLLYDKSGEVFCILEYKKCTDAGTIKMEEQSFTKYLSMDKSKYKRLNILRKYFSLEQGGILPLINIIYPTTNENIIKIEEITEELEVAQSYVLEIKEDPEENQRNIIKTILEKFTNK
jgi:hypothetical protein